MTKKYYKTYLLARATVAECDATQEIVESKPKSISIVDTEALESQVDLLKMQSILVSTGINLNDDVFLPEELLEARSTAAHKPVNIEHDESKIIGHMLRSFVTDKDGKTIAEEIIDEGNAPDDFDITNEAVIYAFQLPEIAEDIKEKAQNGELFVSVEAFFTDYDFLVGNQVIERNENTDPILDPILRINGGAGVFKGQQVGRVLRNILLGGIGVVAVPANPDSVIKSIGSLQSVDVSTIDEVLASHVVSSLKCVASSEGESDMPKNDKEDLKKKFRDEAAAILKANEGDKQPTEPVATVEVKSILAENQKLSDRIRVFEIEKLKVERTEALQQIGLPLEMIDVRIDRCIAMDKDEFEIHLADLATLVKGLASAEKSANDKGGDEGTDVVISLKVETEVVEEITTEEGVDKVEASFDTEEEDTLSVALDNIKIVDAELSVVSDKPSKSNVDEVADMFEEILMARNPSQWGKLKK